MRWRDIESKSWINETQLKDIANYQLSTDSNLLEKQRQSLGPCLIRGLCPASVGDGILSLGIMPPIGDDHKELYNKVSL